MIDLVGKKFNRVLVLEYSHMDKYKNKYWLCKCDCGLEKIFRGTSLTSGHAKSCGCIRDMTDGIKHGMYNSTEYHTWENMVGRCHNKKHKKYHTYGGRGIKMCDDWKNDFRVFYKDMGKKPKGMTIERIDNNKGYTKENCKWVTHKEQQNNRRNNHMITFNSKTQTLAQWCNELNLNYSTTISRILALNWSVKKTLTTSTKSKFNGTG